MKDAYTTKELSNLLGTAQRTVTRRAQREGWDSRPRAGRGGGLEWIVSSMPEDTRLRVVREAEMLPTPGSTSAPSLATMAITDQQRAKALARADIVNLYVDWMREAPRGGKAQARKDFILAYKGGAWAQLLEVLGSKVSWQSIERWKVQLRRKGSVVHLVDNRGGAKCAKRAMTDRHADILLRVALNPNNTTISGCIENAGPAMKAAGLDVPSAPTMRRFLKRWQETNFGTWVYTREGKKAWNDKAAFFIERDYGRIEVGDIMVADGHILNFETTNPWTGKAQRMELVMWYDMASNCPLGWEIMPTENTQAIASAFRRACMALGKYPRIAYLDNGRAFRSKYFNGVDFRQTGIGGLFQELGVHTIFAWPYHGQSKTIERFFGTLHNLEQWVPSYVGNCIDAKPPRLNRGEDMHRKAYAASGCRPLTLEETHVAVAQWIDKYIQRPQRGHLNGRCPAEVFIAGRGPGVDARELRHLMMAKDIRKLSREGIRMFGNRYYAPELYSRTHAVQVRYDITDLRAILVYDKDGKHLICEAPRMEGIHPAASILGDDKDRLALDEALRLKKGQEREASTVVRGVLADALVDQRRRMAALEPPTAPEQEKAAPLSQQKLRAIKSAKAKAIQAKADGPTYTPPAEKHDIYTELDRYEYLFFLSVRDGLELREADQEWMEYYESTEEYAEVAARRFTKLRALYARQRKQQEASAC